MKHPHAKQNDHAEQPMPHLLGAAKANHRKLMNDYQNQINLRKLTDKRNRDFANAILNAEK